MPVLLVSAAFLAAKNFNQVFSSEFTNASATLTNARLSFLSALEGAQTVGSSLVTIDTTNYPSRSVLQLQNRDNITINGNPYIVATTIDDANDNTFSMTTALASGDVADNLPVAGVQRSTLTVRLTTVSALADGSFRILVPASGNTAASANGIPDSGGFDFGSGTTASINCPALGADPDGYTAFSATTQSSSASGISIGGVYYHSFVCDYSGTGAVGSSFDNTDYPPFTISNLINPAPRVGGAGHTLGQADTYPVIIQQRDASGVIVDQTTTKVGVVDAVKVSATIAPQISFSITGLSSGTSACGLSTDVTTTALSVPFGELPIGQFVNAAQRLEVTTNAIGGYAVTVAENDQLGRNANVCPGSGSGTAVTCILDAVAGGMTHLTSANWTNTTDTGFGYTLQGITAGITLNFFYNESGRTYSARQFADLEGAEAPVQIFSRSTVASADQVNVCYRIIPAVTNAAGNYENYLIYTASATF